MDKKEKKKEKLFKKQMPSEKNVKKENVQSTDNVEVLEEEHFKKEQTESTFDEDKYKQEITKLTDENKKLVEKVQLAQAELINYRRRKDEEVSSMLKYANVDLVTEILNVVDDFERAVNHAEKSINDEVKKYNEGINLIYTNLKSILQKFGVEEINNVGSIFNPNEEQALLTDCVEDKDDEVVLEVLQKGYKLKDRVIRPASVKINQK